MTKTLDDKKQELARVLKEIEGLRVQISELDAERKALAKTHRSLEDLAMKLAAEIAGLKTLF